MLTAVDSRDSSRYLPCSSMYMILVRRSRTCKYSRQQASKLKEWHSSSVSVSPTYVVCIRAREHIRARQQQYIKYEYLYAEAQVQFPCVVIYRMPVYLYDA